MATERFFKLPAEKQKRILDAAREEFARVPFEEVSINQIIKNADISRGSFYTYFVDKADLIDFLFEEQERMAIDSIKNVFLACQGDYWLFLQKWLEMTMSYSESDIVKQNVAIFKMCGFRNLDRQFGHVKDDLHREKYEESHRELNDWLYTHLKPGTVDLNRSREEISLMFRLTMETLFTTLLHALLSESREERERCMQDFLLYIDLIKFGAAGKALRKDADSENR